MSHTASHCTLGPACRGLIPSEHEGYQVAHFYKPQDREGGAALLGASPSPLTTLFCLT